MQNSLKHTSISELLKTYSMDEVVDIIQKEIDSNSEYRRKLNSIKIGDLVKIGNKDVVVIELINDEYVQVQFIEMPYKAYIERKIIIKDNSKKYDNN